MGISVEWLAHPPLEGGVGVSLLDYPPSRIGWRTSRNSHGPHPK